MRRIIPACALLIAALPAYAQSVNEPSAPDPLAAADQMRKNGNLQGAAAMYAQLARQPGDSIDAHLALASIDRKLGKFDDEAAVLRAALSRKPDDTRLMNQLGQALVSGGKPEEAVNVYDMLLAIQPKNVQAYNGKAVAFDNAGNHVAAQEIYHQALAIAPDTPTVLNNLGMSLVLNGQLDEAIAVLEPLSEKENAAPTVRQNLAMAYGLKGNMEKARELNMRDLSPQQTEENLRFYAHYNKMKQDQKPSDLVNEIMPPGQSAAPVMLLGAKSEPPATPAPSSPLAIVATPEAPVAAPAPVVQMPPAPVAEAPPAAPAPVVQMPPAASPPVATQESNFNITAPAPPPQKPAEETKVDVSAPAPIAEVPSEMPKDTNVNRATPEPKQEAPLFEITAPPAPAVSETLEAPAQEVAAPATPEEASPSAAAPEEKEEQQAEEKNDPALIEAPEPMRPAIFGNDAVRIFPGGKKH